MNKFLISMHIFLCAGALLANPFINSRELSAEFFGLLAQGRSLTESYDDRLNAIAEELVEFNDRIEKIASYEGSPAGVSVSESNRLPLYLKVVERLNQKKKNLSELPAEITLFDSSTVPGITLSEFAKKLKDFLELTDEDFVVAKILIERYFRFLKQVKKSEVWPTNYNIHRLLLTALLISNKLNSEKPYGSLAFVRVAGIKNSELNKLERYFLISIGWKTHVSREKYEEVLKSYYN
jgi:hypothetical protein